MSKRVCLESGCPLLIDAGEGRCTKHKRVRDKARGTRQDRGYDAVHDRLRAVWQRKLDAGHMVTCWRCNKPIDPNDWTLGHCDIDRSIYHGPECPPCDYATSGRTGCPHESHAAS